MSPKTSKQFDEIRMMRKKQIMRVALRLFADKGYPSTSIHLISQKAGISKGLLYNYFLGKEDLLKAIIDEGIDEMLMIFDPNKDGVLTPDEFRFFVSELFLRLSRDIKLWKLYFSLIMQASVQKLMAQRFHEISLLHGKILIEYFSKKGCPKPELEVLFFHMIMDGVALNYVMNPGDFPLSVLEQMIIDRFI